MRRLPSCLSALLLAASAYLSVASLSFGGDDDGWEPEPDPPPVVVVPAEPRVDETWVVENLFDGQTAVSRDVRIRLTLGRRDFELDRDDGLYDIRLRRADHAFDVPYRLVINEAWTELSPTEALEADTDYELDLNGVRDNVFAERVLPPGPIWFSTRPAPRVTGLWRSGQTLIIAFSEPMEAAGLALGFAGVNLLWEEGGELRSLAGDWNLAAFAWRTEAHLFLMGSIAFADERGPLWVQVSGDVRGASGAPLDGDGNGVPGEVGDDYLEWVDTRELPTCFTREDLPAPCVRAEDVPDLVDDSWW